MSQAGKGRRLRLLGNIFIVAGALVLAVALLFLSGAIKVMPGGERPTQVVGRPPIVGTSTAPPSPGSATPRPSLSPSPLAIRPSQAATPFASGTPAPEAKPALPTLPPTPVRRAPAVRLRLPRLGIDARVVEVGWKIVSDGGTPRAEWETAEHAAGHHIDSANPGEVGNVVFSGHHNIKGEVFKGLWDAKKGDEVLLLAQDGATFRYIVVEDALILPEKDATEAEREAHARYMDQTPDSRVTLITCWPPTDNTHRVIVIGQLSP